MGHRPREVLSTVRQTRAAAYTTISSMLDGLYQRDLLSRERVHPGHGQSSPWRYTPLLTRQEMLMHAIDQICQELQIDQVERQYAALVLRGRRAA